MQDTPRLFELGWEYEISHHISLISKDYLSMSIVYNSYTGGPHPNTTINTLNFKFHPDTILYFNDVVNYSDLHKFLLEAIISYGDDDQKEYLPNYIEYFSDRDLDFTFNQTSLEISFTNHLPRAIMVLGSLEIPLNRLNLRIKI